MEQGNSFIIIIYLHYKQISFKKKKEEEAKIDTETQSRV